MMKKKKKKKKKKRKRKDKRVLGYKIVILPSTRVES